MDSLTTAAAQALASGDPLGALNRVALRGDPPALALRGLAMAQLGDFQRARALLRAAERAFAPGAAVARARCVVAQAEIALVSRDLGWPMRLLAVARQTLEAHGDVVNALQARLIEVRRALLIGRLAEAEQLQADVARRIESARRPAGRIALPVALLAVADLGAAGIASRRLRSQVAQAALDRAARTADGSGIAALAAEVEQARRALAAPAARWRASGEERLVTLHEVESLLASDDLIVDACRHAVRQGRVLVPLATRPILFALVRRLANDWPDDVGRADLVADAFRTRHADDTHRARLRVEVGRLRALLAPVAGVQATERGFLLVAPPGVRVCVLAQPFDVSHPAVLALLADGEAWSSSALALALGTTQRSVQRALEALAAQGRVQPIGQARARRWMTPPLARFATVLLLPAALPLD